MNNRALGHVKKSQYTLEKAARMLELEYADDAGRLAYIAGFHAALAFISLRSDKTPKTHSGTRSEFANLARHEPVIDRIYTTFLAESYKLKTFADYGIEDEAIVTLSEAQDAINLATRFVELIESLIKSAK